nr:hypothetical protein BaRGS_004973 [Batillaria attramentaria]
MRVVLVVSLLVACSLAAPAPDKRFIGSISDLWHQAVDSVSHVFNQAKDQFNKLTDGLNINFDSVVNALIPMIDSDMTEGACHNVCVGSAATVLGPAAPLAGSVCGDVCKA